MDTSWRLPPTDVLGHVVPVQQFVARTGHVVVALRHVIAFPEGCLLTLQLAVRRGALDDAAWERLLVGRSGADPDLEATENGPRFGVRFSDGSRATTAEHAFPGWAPSTDRPEPPMLVDAGSESSSDDRHFDGLQQLWLWPLPPPGPFELVVEWRDLGVNLVSVALDGETIVRAAENALPFWT